MINPAELRFGNWINEQGLELQVGLIQNNLFENSDPIPLTEEWLLKFGFDFEIEYYVSVLSYDFGEIKIYPYSNHFMFIEGCLQEEIKHVHKLQNLYFALTNFELNIDNGK